MCDPILFPGGNFDICWFRLDFMNQVRQQEQGTRGDCRGFSQLCFTQEMFNNVKISRSKCQPPQVFDVFWFQYVPMGFGVWLMFLAADRRTFDVSPESLEEWSGLEQA